VKATGNVIRCWTGDLKTTDEVEVGQMRNEDGIPCSHGLSAIMKVRYQANRTYVCSSFAGVGIRPSEGIYFSKNKEDALWWTHN
jgi:hypothetical protein